MPDQLAFAVGQTRDFDQPLHEINVDTGTLVVTIGTDTKVVASGVSFSVGDKAGVHLHAPNGARATVTYSHEAPEAPAPRKRVRRKRKKAKAAPRGDSSKSNRTGALEARARDELRALAKKRGVKGYSKLDKAGLVKALRK